MKAAFFLVGGSDCSDKMFYESGVLFASVLEVGARCRGKLKSIFVIWAVNVEAVIWIDNHLM